MDQAPPHQGSRRRRWRGRVGATALSAGVHAAMALVILIGWRTTAPSLVAVPIAVSFAPPLPPPKPPAPPSPAPRPARHAATHKAAAAPKLAAAHVPHRRRDRAPPQAARPSPAPPADESPPAAVVEASGAGDGDGLTQSQLAGAQAAGEGDGGGSGDGGGGGECNMARRVQAALRKDPLARAAVHAAGGRALMIWNGDWVQHGAEDGKGLAAVREAIILEVGFAPAACRHQRVRGLVLISLADGSARLALGAGDWRWSDLLGLR